MKRPRPSYHDQLDDARARIVASAIRAAGGRMAVAAASLQITREAFVALRRRLRDKARARR